MTLERDFLLIDRYRILEILGQGGMGAVYRAVDENLGLEVAVKENLFTSDEYTRQFRREATILANLRHSNLPRVSDHFEVENKGQYLVMDYIEGEDLRQRMDRIGVLPEEDVIVIGAAICDALQYLHTREPVILHRDIKPGNIKINPDGIVYLVDFGLAKIVHGTQATTTGARAMTPGYSSPEQYGTARTDQRSDIYSLGATLYASLTGSIPEDGLARAMEQADLTEIRKHNPRVSRRLSAVLEKGLAIHPEDRYQAAIEYKQALLNASTATRQLGAPEEMTVSPPPEDADAEKAKVNRVEASPAIQPQIRMSSESTSRLRRKRSKRNMRLAIGALVLFAVFGIAWLATGGLESVFGGGDISSITITATDAAEISPTTQQNSSTEEAPTPGNTSTPQPTPTGVSIVGVAFTPTPTPLVGPTLNEVIAFASDRSGSNQIWTLDTGTNRLTQITEQDGGACQPEWSPDAKFIAFVSPCEGNRDFYLDSQIYAINLETNQTTLLIAETGVFDPAWSPDGASLLFVKAKSVTDSQIFRLNFSDNTIVWMTQRIKVNIAPSWSPDGKSILFSSSRKGGLRLYVMRNIRGIEPKLLTRSQTRDNYNATWSPLDGKIIFSQKIQLEGTLRRLVYVYENMLDITDLNQYVETPFANRDVIVPEHDPDISPEGYWVAFESWPDGNNHDIWVLHWDADARIRLTTDPADDFDPAWKP